MKEVCEHIPPLGKRNEAVKFIESYHKIDDMALVFIPTDASQDLIPVLTFGDGNCLCHALSHVCVPKKQFLLQP